MIPRQQFLVVIGGLRQRQTFERVDQPAVWLNATTFGGLIKGVPLRVTYPFVALAYFIVPTLAYFLLGEALSWNTYAGAIIIATGVMVSVFR